MSCEWLPNVPPRSTKTQEEIDQIKAEFQEAIPARERCHCRHYTHADDGCDLPAKDGAGGLCGPCLRSSAP